MKIKIGNKKRKILQPEENGECGEKLLRFQKDREKWDCQTKEGFTTSKVIKMKSEKLQKFWYHSRQCRVKLKNKIRQNEKEGECEYFMPSKK